MERSTILLHVTLPLPEWTTPCRWGSPLKWSCCWGLATLTRESPATLSISLSLEWATVAWYHYTYLYITPHSGYALYVQQIKFTHTHSRYHPPPSYWAANHWQSSQWPWGHSPLVDPLFWCQLLPWTTRQWYSDGWCALKQSLPASAEGSR